MCRSPAGNVGLARLPMAVLRLADWILMSPRLFQHLSSRGVHTYVWVLNTVGAPAPAPAPAPAGGGVRASVLPGSDWSDDGLPRQAPAVPPEEGQLEINSWIYSLHLVLVLVICPIDQGP